MSINIDKAKLKDAIGLTDEEEWYYKLLCAMTDPVNVGYWETGSSFTAPEKCYFFGVDYTDIAVSAYDAVYLNLPAHSMFNIGRPILVVLGSGEKLFVANATGMGGFYVTESVVNAVANARATWFKRLKYLTTTVPTRYKVKHTAAKQQKDTIITVTNKAILGMVSYVSILGGDLFLYDGANYRNMFALAGACYSGTAPDFTYGYFTRVPLAPLRPIGGKSWDLRSFSADHYSANVCNLYFEVYDNLPSPPW